MGGVRLSLIFLIAANIVPIIGVFLFGWSVPAILVLYWLESVIIGLLNIPKMWACEGWFGSKLFLTAFFSFHYGMFCFGHAAFIAEIFDGRPEFESLLNGGPLVWTALTFFISHFISMMINFFGRKEYVDRTPNEQMFMPYGRIFVMHIVILGGGFLAQMFGAPILALVLLVVLKTAIDYAVHQREHDKSLKAQTS